MWCVARVTCLVIIIIYDVILYQEIRSNADWTNYDEKNFMFYIVAIPVVEPLLYDHPQNHIDVVVFIRGMVSREG